MTSPATLAGTSIGGTAAGGILSAFGAFSKGQADASMYKYRAGMAVANQKLALQNADYASIAGENQARIEGLKEGQRKGQIVAGQGASGIDIGSGSSKDVRESQDFTTRFDLQTIRNNAARVAFGYQTEAATDKAQAGLYDLAADNSMKAGEIGAAGSLLSGAAGVSDKWLQAKQYGLFT